jgi:2-dehydropantoate 2-reductase
VAVIGAGSVGAVVAASATAAGQSVVVCTRTPFENLVVTRQGVDHTVAAAIATDPAWLDTFDPADVVALCLKVPDTDAAEPWLRRLCGPDTVVVTLQNGLDHVARVAPLLPPGADGVVPAVVYVAAERTAPGRVVHHGANSIVLPPGPHTGRITAALGPEVAVTVEHDFVTALWRKLVSNVVVNPLTALTMRRVDVMADPAIAGLARGLLAEAAATARAAGAHIDDEEVDALIDLYRTSWAQRNSGSSMFYDRLGGRPLEHEALTGALVDVAHRHRVPVPLNEAMLALLRVIDPAAERAERAAASS